MKIIVSKKAANIISTFSNREKDTHEYMLQLYQNTVEKIEGCTKEIEVYKNENPIYRQTNKAQFEAEFRLKYIYQCLQLSVNYDYEARVLTIQSNIYEDKDTKTLIKN